MYVFDRAMLLLQDRPTMDGYAFQMRAQVFKGLRRHAREDAIADREGRGDSTGR